MAWNDVVTRARGALNGTILDVWATGNDGFSTANATALGFDAINSGFSKLYLMFETGLL